MKKLLIFCIAFCFTAIEAKAECLSVYDPYKGGVYASQLLEFRPGFWIKTRGALATGYRKFKKNTPLHHTRVMFPEPRVLGCPKATLEQSLTLGHGGYVIVGPHDCFKNGKGTDIIIHEPRSDMNLNETFHVYVTDDKNGQGPWYEVARDIAVSSANNYLELELEGIVNERGYPLEEFFWVKIIDANSQLVYGHERFSGFDLSAVKFMHQCSVPIGWNLSEDQETRLSGLNHRNGRYAKTDLASLTGISDNNNALAIKNPDYKTVRFRGTDQKNSTGQISKVLKSKQKTPMFGLNQTVYEKPEDPT